MFEKILIANRGEIAVRIMRTCRELGIKTVAVHSAADAHSLHVRTADESVDLGDGPASSTYLNTAAIIRAAKRTGCQAVHPGYGFLAESAEFAGAVTDAGLVFIGPSAHAIATMGEKVASRAVALAASVPLAPGSEGSIADPSAIIEFGDEHGYPVLVKASYGGGGRGMRLVGSASEAVEAFGAAVREATAAFGNGEVYCERYLVNARHVEVQVFGDSHGDVVYLGDRDCSVQRRHQKLIEEAPAPGLSDEVRRSMGEAAVRLARQVHYVGAGTVEFLYEEGKFYFLEMNTRIQVEHPVTEAVTGLDLVALQLRVAAGQPLGITQESVRPEGAAIEVRVNAEDPSEGMFVPSPGLIATLEVPEAEGLRWDAGYQSGDEVLPLYDSLVGKLIAWGPTRDAAIQRLQSAMAQVQIEGIRTTIPAAQHILALDAFKSVDIGTTWLEDSVVLPDFSEDQGDEDARFDVEVAGRYYRIPTFPEDGVMAAPAGAAAPTADAEAGSARAGGRSGTRRRRSRASDGTVKAPMQGTIVKVNVEAGDDVTAGALLFVLEAMKMENPIKATHDGRIEAVHVSLGDSTPAGTLLASYVADGV